MHRFRKRTWIVILTVMLGSQMLFVGRALATCPDSMGGTDAKCYPGEGPSGEDCPENTRSIASGASGGGGGGVDRHDCASNQVCCEQVSDVEKEEKAATLEASTGCKYGGVKAGSNCWTDYCQPDAPQYVMTCMPQSECAAKYGGAGGPGHTCPRDGQPAENNFCCKVNKNECKRDYDGPDKDSVKFVCTTDSDCSTLHLTGYTDTECKDPTPICCKKPDTPEDTSATSKGGSFVIGNRKYQPINSFCWTQVDCTKASAAENWVKGGGCLKKGNWDQGLCKAPVPEYSLQYPLGSVTTIAGLKNFIAVIFNYAMGIIIIVAAVIFIYGGLRYVFSAVANDIQTAKTIMVDSLVGLVLGFGAYAILANINYNTINLRSFDVYMINKLSFFGVTYCKDVKPTTGQSTAMFQDAGLPTAPLSLDITKGYTVKTDETKCGHEYFIDGGDSYDVCNGTSCGDKPGTICLNCASGSAEDCQSTSEREMHCTAGHIGGNIILSTGMEPKAAKAMLFCIYRSGSDVKSITKELDSADITVGNVSGGSTTGGVGGYKLKHIVGKQAEIQAFQKDCTDHGADAAYMAIVADFDGPSNALDTAIKAGWIVASPITGVPYAITDSLIDTSFVLGKTACDKNIFAEDTGAQVYKGLISSFSSWAENAVIRPPVFWSIDDVLKIAEGKDVLTCNFSAIGERE